MKKIFFVFFVVGVVLFGVVSVGVYVVQNFFVVQELSSGYSVVVVEKVKEGFCGEVKCGVDKGKCEVFKVGYEGSCGVDCKVKEGFCGGEKKVGEGNCGVDKKKL